MGTTAAESLNAVASSFMGPVSQLWWQGRLANPSLHFYQTRYFNFTKALFLDWGSSSYALRPSLNDAERDSCDNGCGWALFLKPFWSLLEFVLTLWKSTLFRNVLERVARDFFFCSSESFLCFAVSLILVLCSNCGCVINRKKYSNQTYSMLRMSWIQKFYFLIAGFSMISGSLFATYISFGACAPLLLAANVMWANKHDLNEQMLRFCARFAWVSRLILNK